MSGDGGMAAQAAAVNLAGVQDAQAPPPGFAAAGNTPAARAARQHAQMVVAPPAGRFQLSPCALRLLCELVLEARAPGYDGRGELVDALVGSFNRGGRRDAGWLDEKLEATLPAGRVVVRVLAGAADLAEGRGCHADAFLLFLRAERFGKAVKALLAELGKVAVRREGGAEESERARWRAYAATFRELYLGHRMADVVPSAAPHGAAWVRAAPPPPLVLVLAFAHESATDLKRGGRLTGLARALAFALAAALGLAQGGGAGGLANAAALAHGLGATAVRHTRLAGYGVDGSQDWGVRVTFEVDYYSGSFGGGGGGGGFGGGGGGMGGAGMGGGVPHISRAVAAVRSETFLPQLGAAYVNVMASQQQQQQQQQAGQAAAAAAAAHPSGMFLHDVHVGAAPGAAWPPAPALGAAGSTAGELETLAELEGLLAFFDEFSAGRWAAALRVMDERVGLVPPEELGLPGSSHATESAKHELMDRKVSSSRACVFVCLFGVHGKKQKHQQQQQQQQLALPRKSPQQLALPLTPRPNTRLPPPPPPPPHPPHSRARRWSASTA